MEDKEIIKALECCIKAETLGDCEEMGCPASTKQGCFFYLRTDDDYENTIYIEILKDALDLINRQKSEIERLKFENLALYQKRITMFERIELVNKARTKAIKEFAERLKEVLEIEDREEWFEVYECGLIREIDNLVKEMTEEQK